MKKYYIMALAACLGLASLSSCSGDLDLKEKGVTTVDEYYIRLTTRLRALSLRFIHACTI